MICCPQHTMLHTISNIQHHMWNMLHHMLHTYNIILQTYYIVSCDIVYQSIQYCMSQGNNAVQYVKTYNIICTYHHYIYTIQYVRHTIQYVGKNPDVCLSSWDSGTCQTQTDQALTGLVNWQNVRITLRTPQCYPSQTVRVNPPRTFAKTCGQKVGNQEIRKKSCEGSTLHERELQLHDCTNRPLFLDHTVSSTSSGP